MQGTLYPDVIESVSVKGPSATIKIAPQRGRAAERYAVCADRAAAGFVQGRGAPDREGAGIAGRDPGETSVSRAGAGGAAARASDPGTTGTLREADAVVVEEIRRAGLYEKVWQAFAVLLPVRSVGVMGDGRTYGLTMRCGWCERMTR